MTMNAVGRCLILAMLMAVAAARPTPPATPNNVDHIVIMRFCLPKAGKEFHEPACAAIITLFETTMLLSLREQNADFRIIAYVGEVVPEHLRARLAQLLEPFPHRIVAVSAFFEPGWHDNYLHEAKVHYWQYISEGSHQYTTRITTRVDVDDFMHRNALQTIQALHSYPRVNGVLVVNQLRGYRMTFTPAPEDASTVRCHLSPMDYPFLAIGQTLITDAARNISILDFVHDRVRFVGALVESVGINATDMPAIVGAFKTMPLERGYIYVRHSLSNSQNLMDVGADAITCDDAADDLYEGFAIKRADVRHIADLIKHASASH